MRPVAAPSAEVRAEAIERLAGLATPAGALGRLGDLAVWVAATQGAVPPEPVERVRAVIFAGDHGVADHGVSAYPKAVTPAMVRTFLAGRAGVSVLAAQHGVTVRVLDIAVDDDLDGVDPAVQAFKVRRGCGAIHVEDAMMPAETQAALDAGAAVAAEEIAAGAQLLVSGDMGIGNTTPAAALISAFTGRSPREVTGRGTGIDDKTLELKVCVIEEALSLHELDLDDPLGTLAALGGLEHAAIVGLILMSAVYGVPVVLDGVVSDSAALVACALSTDCVGYLVAGHLSAEPGATVALEHLGLEAVFDLRMRLGEGTGGLLAVPVVQAGARVLREMATMEEMGIG